METAETYDYLSRKTVVLLAASVPPKVAMNVVGHLSLAVGAHSPEGLMGTSPLTDGSGVLHTGISRFPIIVLKASAARVRAAVTLARAHDDLFVADYPKQMLDTQHDDELVSALLACAEADLAYFGVAATGPTEAINSIFGKFSLW